MSKKQKQRLQGEELKKQFNEYREEDVRKLKKKTIKE